MKPRSSRVPVVLQQIFLKSSGGEDIQNIQPPKNGLGFRVFIFQQTKDSKGKTNIASSSEAEEGKKSDTSQTLKRVESASETFCKINPISEDKRKERKPINTPQGFLDAALDERGYSTEKFVSIEGGYYCHPTPLQKASYGTRMNEAVLNSDAKLLRRLLDVGLSPNPCNDFGESLVHRICRRGDHKLLRVLIEKGCCLQIADDYGRTPLHDAFWKAEPSKEILILILKADPDLIRLMDCRGFVPLDYVRKEDQPEMIQFLQQRILDPFFPPRQDDTPSVPVLTQKQPHSSPVPDPRKALPPRTAALVANGEIEPEDALNWDDDDSSVDWNSDDDSDSEDLDFDEAEILELCRPLAVSNDFQSIKLPVAMRSFVRETPLNMTGSNLSIHSKDHCKKDD